MKSGSKLSQEDRGLGFLLDDVSSSKGSSFSEFSPIN